MQRLQLVSRTWQKHAEQAVKSVPLRKTPVVEFLSSMQSFFERARDSSVGGDAQVQHDVSLLHDFLGATVAKMVSTKPADILRPGSELTRLAALEDVNVGRDEFLDQSLRVSDLEARFHCHRQRERPLLSATLEIRSDGNRQLEVQAHVQLQRDLGLALAVHFWTPPSLPDPSPLAQ